MFSGFVCLLLCQLSLFIWVMSTYIRTLFTLYTTSSSLLISFKIMLILLKCTNVPNSLLSHHSIVQMCICLLQIRRQWPTSATPWRKFLKRIVWTPVPPSTQCIVRYALLCANSKYLMCGSFSHCSMLLYAIFKF